MSIKPSHYEALLAEYSDRHALIELLKQFRPYLEMLPSMRRPSDSLIGVPLPLIRIRIEDLLDNNVSRYRNEVIQLPCDIGILMCDPEWKIKTGVEIFIFIYRPGEDFSDLLRRWRKTQVLLHNTYEWVLPPRYKHILTDGADDVLPLFVAFDDTPKRVLKGLRGASLPYVIQHPKAGFIQETEHFDDEEAEELSFSEIDISEIDLG